MARDFSKNLSNYMALGANAINPLVSGAAKISMAAWVNADAFDGSAVSFVLRVSVDNTNVGLSLGVDSNANGNPVSVQARAAAAEPIRTISGATAVTTSVWHHIGGVANFPADTIEPYLDGASDGGPQGVSFTASAYTPGTPTTQQDGIGTRVVPPVSTANQWDGRIAEVALWNDDIGAAGFAMLGRGFCPLLVRPDKLVFYLPLRGFGGSAGPEIDLRNGRSGTITGSVPIADQVRAFYPAGRGFPAIAAPITGWAREGLALPILTPGLIS